MARFKNDPSYRGLQGGGSPQDLMQRLLRDYQGSQKNLQFNTSQVAKPFIGAGLYDTDAYGSVQQAWQDPSRSDLTRGYGKVAGQLGQQGRRALEGGQNSLALAGLGRSGAQAALADRVAGATSAEQANVFAQMQQQSQELRNQLAMQAFDVDRAISQLILQSIAPYQSKPDDSGGIGGIAGQALGTAVSLLPMAF